MPLNVLVVDDSSVMRAMIIKTIRMSGLDLGDVYQAANGREGLDAAKANWVDLVVAEVVELNGKTIRYRVRYQ